MIDLQIISSSRPECLGPTIESFFERIKTTHKLNKIMHEDVLSEEYHQGVIELANKYDFQLISEENPGYYAPTDTIELMRKLWKTDYVFHLEDDWVFERDIDLDKIIEIFDKHDNVDCIFFNKQRNTPWMTKFYYKEVDYEGVTLLPNFYWPFLPGVWRTSTFRKFWKWEPNKEAVGLFNKNLGNVCGGQELRDRADRDESGIYIYGKIWSARYVRHIGENITSLKWRVKRNFKFSHSDWTDSVVWWNDQPWLPKRGNDPEALQR